MYIQKELGKDKYMLCVLLKSINGSCPRLNGLSIGFENDLAKVEEFRRVV